MYAAFVFEQDNLAGAAGFFFRDRKQMDACRAFFISRPASAIQCGNVNNLLRKLVVSYRGLVPEDECYDICQNAWTKYIQKTLFSLITTGKGTQTVRANRKLKTKRNLGLQNNSLAPYT